MYLNPCPSVALPPVTMELYTALLEAATSGEKEITYADKKIVYHNVADLMKVLSWMWRILNGQASGGRIAMTYESGLTRPRYGLETEEEDFRHY